MSEDKTRSIVEIPFYPDSNNRRLLNSYMNVIQKYNNEVSGIVFPKVEKMMLDPRIAESEKTHGGIYWKKIASVAKEYGVDKSSIEKIGKELRNDKKKGWYMKCNSQVLQAQCERIFKKIKKYVEGDSSHLSFIPKGELNSFESKQMNWGISFFYIPGKHKSVLKIADYLKRKKKDDKKAKTYEILIKVQTSHLDEYKVEVLATREWKRFRIVRRTIRGKERWFLQIIYVGQPPRRRKAKKAPSDSVMSVDLNVRSAAIVGNLGYSEMYAFESVIDVEQDRKIAAIQRAMEKERRAANPNLYHADELKKKGKKMVLSKGKPKTRKEREYIKDGQVRVRAFKRTKRYLSLQVQYREENRKRTARIQQAHRRECNLLLDRCVHFKAEDIDGRGWAKLYGNSVAATSQFFFYRELARKAVVYGGSFMLFSTYQTALSQRHLDGSSEKKTLSVRTHRDATGREMHRDLFSSFLGLFVESWEETYTQKGKEKTRTNYKLECTPALIAEFDRLYPGMKKTWDSWLAVSRELWEQKPAKVKNQTRKAIRRASKSKSRKKIEDFRIESEEIFKKGLHEA